MTAQPLIETRTVVRFGREKAFHGWRVTVVDGCVELTTLCGRSFGQDVPVGQRIARACITCPACEEEDRKWSAGS